jgi:hypothetical protein
VSAAPAPFFSMGIWLIVVLFRFYKSMALSW